MDSSNSSDQSSPEPPESPELPPIAVPHGLPKRTFAKTITSKQKKLAKLEKVHHRLQLIAENKHTVKHRPEVITLEYRRSHRLANVSAPPIVRTKSKSLANLPNPIKRELPSPEADKGSPEKLQESNRKRQAFGKQKDFRSTYDLNAGARHPETGPKTNLNEAAWRKLNDKWKKDESQKPRYKVTLPADLAKQRAEQSKKPNKVVINPEGGSNVQPKDIPVLQTHQIPSLELTNCIKKFKDLGDFLNKKDSSLSSKHERILNELKAMITSYNNIKNGRSSMPDAAQNQARIFNTVCGIKLYEDQILTLMLHGQVDDSVFEALVRETVRILKENDGIICYVVPVVLTKLLSESKKNPKTTQEYLDNLLNAVNMDQIEVILFPIHHAEHYYIMFADMHEAKIHLFDPTQPDSVVTNKSLLHIMGIVCDGLKIHTNNNGWTYVDETGVIPYFHYNGYGFPVQQDGINCCPLCVAFVQQFFYLESAFSSQYIAKLQNLGSFEFRYLLLDFLRA